MKEIIKAGAGVVGALALMAGLVGVSTASWQRPVAAPQHLALAKASALPVEQSISLEGKYVELKGVATCGECIGSPGGPCQDTVKLATDTGLVFLIPESELSEWHEIANACDRGYHVRARGTIATDGSNYRLMAAELEIMPLG